MRFSHSKRCSRPHFPIIFSGNELDFYLSDICTYNFSFDKSRKTIFAFKSESLICLWIKPRKIRFQFASFVLEKRAQISLHNCFGFENPPENLLNDFDMLCKQFSCQANTINCFHETDKSIEIPSEIDVIQPHQLTLISAWFNKSYKNLCRHRLNIIINYLMQLTIVCLSVCLSYSCLVRLRRIRCLRTDCTVFDAQPRFQITFRMPFKVLQQRQQITNMYQQRWQACVVKRLFKF